MTPPEVNVTKECSAPILQVPEPVAGGRDVLSHGEMGGLMIK